MKILLVNPPFEWGEVKSGEGIVPPLGLLYIASTLLQNGFSVDLLDVRALSLNKESISREITKRNPDIVGISSMTISAKEAYDIAKIIKDVDQDIKVIIGGAHISALPTTALKECEHIDIGVFGEGEVTSVELIKTMEEGHDLGNVKGIVYRKNSRVVKNEPRALIKNLDTLPFPARELLNWEKYSRVVHRTLFSKKVKEKFTTMISSRSCPFDCVYCDKPVFGRGWRARSPENVVDEIKHVVDKYRVGDISFHDDLFTFDKKRVMKICDLIIEEGLDISWASDSRVDTIDKELLAKMKKAGCTNIFFGVETGDPQIMKNIRKRITLEQVRDAVKLTKDAGLRVTTSFMFGLPGETIDTARRTIKFAKSLNSDITHFNITTPFPGSPYYIQLEAEGRILTHNWSEYNPHGLKTIFKHENLSSDEIVRLHKEAYKSYYLRPAYVIPKMRDAMANPRGFIRGSLGVLKILIGKAN
jgi:radical SAM superfamily enzyme YgiQ (UPF0313 family)